MKVGASLRLLSFTLVLSCSGLMYATDQASAASQCVECHNKVTPNIVSDWKLSKQPGGDHLRGVSRRSTQLFQRRSQSQIAAARYLRNLSLHASRPIQEGEALDRVGGNEGDAYNSLAADGND